MQAPEVNMSGGSLLRHRLEHMDRVLSGYVERKDLPGFVALVSCHDDLHIAAGGTLSFDNPAPMQRDTIFRIASITKPVTAAAAMILVEDCALRLDDPIDGWLPELADRRVLKSIASEPDDTVPARRAITVRDLLTSCMGFGSVMAMPDTYPIQKLIREYCIGGDGPKLQSQWPRTDEWLRRLGSLPLLAQPGERWMYDVSSNVLGALIERAAGQSLGAFMRDRIFEPLGMKDTSFRLPAEKAARLPDFYFFNHRTQALEVFESAAQSTWLADPPFESGAGGLVATIEDYLAFSRMLLSKGRHGRQQILSRAAVDLMTSDQVTPAQRSGAEVFFGTHSSWGFGLAVDVCRAQTYHNPGRFGWTGGFGTTAYVDPARDLIGILFTQRLMDSPDPPRVFTDFWTCAYAAAV
jgi:CubicO group peptidase (beta-lactamase class C family)